MKYSLSRKVLTIKMVKSNKAKEQALQKQLLRMITHKDPVKQMAGGASNLSATPGYQNYKKFGKYLLTEPFYVNFKGIKGLSKAHVKSVLWKHVKESEDPIAEAKLIFKRIGKEDEEEFPSDLELFHAVVYSREEELSKKANKGKAALGRPCRKRPKTARQIKLVGDGGASEEAETKPLKITKKGKKGKLKMEDGLVTGEISQEVLREAVRRVMEGM